MHHLWKGSELEPLGRAGSVPEIVGIATLKLRRMHTTGRSIVLICGATSAHEHATGDENLALLLLAIEQAREKHVLVFDQMPLYGAAKRIAESQGSTFDPSIFAQVLDPLLETRLISTLLFLRNWEYSPGATHERARAEELGLIIGDYDSSWLAGHTLITAM